ncbi:MAG: glycosyltransferase [Alistipes sp.]|jgi:glycosyltransferase involved in cell wall biosynthesis|nr:glycosyltransferase [Alistipes sp.]
MSALVSVIVPVYNAERWLARCVESVLWQTHSELELILVNDGSTDGSGAMCDAAAGDPRVRVIHKANAGVSAARNDGVEAARGEWIAFCDNDDFYAPGMLARLLALCNEHDADIAQCACAKGTAESLPAPAPQQAEVFTGRDILENFYTAASIYVWDKLYRRHVWAEVRFPVGSYTDEDQHVVHHLLGAARRVAVTRETLYYHYIHPASVMNRGFDVRWATGAFDDRIDYARRNDLPGLLAETLVRRLYKERYLLSMNRRHNPDPASRRAFDILHRPLPGRYYREIKLQLGIGAKTRLFAWLCFRAPLVYHLYNWLKWRVARGERGVRFGEIK